MMIFNDQDRSCHPERMSRSPERSEGEGSGSMAQRCFAALSMTVNGLPTSSGSDGQHIVCQASGDVQRPFTTCLLYDVLALTH